MSEIYILIELLGRIIFGGFFVANGFNHLKQVGPMTEYAKSKGVPEARKAVLASGWIILISGLVIMVGLSNDITLWALAAISGFLIIVSFKMHAFWKVDAENKMNEKINFTKNMAILGGALMSISTLI